MPDRAEQIRQTLANLVDGRSRWGAAVVSRDGIAVATQMARPVSDESFSAMTAAMLGAAEGAIMEWADDRPETATISGKTVRLSIQTLDDEFFLAVATPIIAGPIQSYALEIEAAAARLRNVLHGQVVVTAG